MMRLPTNEEIGLFLLRYGVALVVMLAVAGIVTKWVLNRIEDMIASNRPGCELMKMGTGSVVNFGADQYRLNEIRNYESIGIKDYEFTKAQ